MGTDDLVVFAMIAAGIAPMVLVQWWMERRRRDNSEYLRSDAAARRQADEAHARGETIAIVLPLGWNTREDAARYGMLVQNYGPDVAQNVRILGREDSSTLLTNLRVLRPSEGIVALADYREGEPPDGLDGDLPSIRGNRHAWMRVCWDNPDGTPGDSDWMRVQRWT
jgi:hypothetical protein